MIKHIVLLNWKPGVTRQQIDEFTAELGKLSNELAEIKLLDCGPDEGFFEANADYAMVAEFESEAEFKAYVAHPKHLELLQQVSGPITESFLSAQFVV